MSNPESDLGKVDALREAEEFLNQFTILYPNEAILRNAVRGVAAYQLSWFDPHRLYGTVRVVNPFIELR